MSIPIEGSFHRALYDSEMTAKLWLAMLESIRCRHAVPAIDFLLMQKLAKVPKNAVTNFFKNQVGGYSASSAPGQLRKRSVAL
jgi:DNA polymerase-3 subunit epsilon